MNTVVVAKPILHSLKRAWLAVGHRVARPGAPKPLPAPPPVHDPYPRDCEHLVRFGPPYC